MREHNSCAAQRIKEEIKSLGFYLLFYILRRLSMQLSRNRVSPVCQTPALSLQPAGPPFRKGSPPSHFI
ncbi:hypothetical protein CLOM621_07932 [Clostridium sp. M62/1]|nr:hypothetical protein CLOM621_07932 [Clostridium sp. M62/1]